MTTPSELGPVFVHASARSGSTFHDFTGERVNV